VCGLCSGLAAAGWQAPVLLFRCNSVNNNGFSPSRINTLRGSTDAIASSECLMRMSYSKLASTAPKILLNFTERWHLPCMDSVYAHGETKFRKILD
jgi:hypothetical protein